MEAIQKQFNEVITYSQQIENPLTDELFKRWETAKSYIKKHFLHDQLIYEFPNKVKFEIGIDTKKQRYIEFVDHIAALLDYSGEIIDYLNSQHAEDFYNNLLAKDYTMEDGKVIKSGTKMIKSFKYFIRDKKFLEVIQNKASELIQEDKVEGRLCFSIHPLDFLSTSENTFNWRSCHSLDGDYRAGNLSYMLDEYTVICYLKSDNDVKLPHFPESVPWNNKKWRCLLFFDESYNVVFAGRQYPFFSNEALDIMRNFIQKSTNIGSYYPWSQETWSHWHNDYIASYNYKEHNDDDFVDFDGKHYCVIDRHIFDIQCIIQDGAGSLHFNDLTRSTCYVPYYMFKRWRVDNSLSFTIGTAVPCLRCGKNHIDESTGNFLCEECAEVLEDDITHLAECQCCSCLFDPEEIGGAIEWITESIICPTCADTECFTCEHCGHLVYNTTKRYSKKLDSFVCMRCFEEEEEE